MNRKHFISTGLATAALITLQNIDALAETHLKPFKKPPFIKPGDTIGITSPAGYITVEEIKPAVQLMQSWGFNVEIGSSIGKRDFTFGGTDEERLIDMQYMLDNPKIKAIMCARGGYGLVRIIDQLRFNVFLKEPKWIIGFSDATVLHCHLSHNYQIASIHAKMCNSFPTDLNLADAMQIDTINSIKNILTGKKITYEAPFNTCNRLGKASGILVGGNLSIIETLAATPSNLNTDGKILFLEDTGEYLYRIDRMFWNLKRSGKLAHLKGLIVGGFKVKPDDLGEEFGKTVVDIVNEKVKNYPYPVAFDFPVGHQRNNYALMCGGNHQLEVKESGTTLVRL